MSLKGHFVLNHQRHQDPTDNRSFFTYSSVFRISAKSRHLLPVYYFQSKPTSVVSYPQIAPGFANNFLADDESNLALIAILTKFVIAQTWHSCVRGQTVQGKQANGNYKKSGDRKTAHFTLLNLLLRSDSSFTGFNLELNADGRI